MSLFRTKAEPLNPAERKRDFIGESRSGNTLRDGYEVLDAGKQRLPSDRDDDYFAPPPLERRRGLSEPVRESGSYPRWDDC